MQDKDTKITSEEFRASSDRLPPPANTLDAIERGILAMIEATVGEVIPFTHISRQFNKSAARAAARAGKAAFGLNELLNSMADRELIAIKRFPRLGRTFIFSGAMYRGCLEDEKAGVPVWINLEKSLADVK